MGTAAESPIYAAVLIRSIMDINQQKFIEGPCRTVDHILQLSGVDSIMSLTGGNSLSFISNVKNLLLIVGQPSVLETILYGPRIGLSDKYPEYRDLKYRYVMGPVKKQRNTLINLTN